MNTMSNEIITFREVMSVPTLCKDGVAQWFAANGLDFKDFVRNGISVERLVATVGEDDYYLNQVLRIKRGD